MVDNNFSLNEVDNFIRKFRNKNKNMKNKQQQEIQNEVESNEKRNDRSPVVLATKQGETKDKPNLYKNNEQNDIFWGNEKENEHKVEEDVNDLFTTKPLSTQPDTSNPQDTKVDTPSLQNNNNKESFVSIPSLSKPINNNIIVETKSDSQQKNPDIEEKVIINNEVPSMEKSIKKENQEQNQNQSTDSLHSRKEASNKQLASTSKIIVHKNPFEDDPDEDPSTLFESKEEIPVVSYTSPLKNSKKKKIIIPQGFKSPENEGINQQKSNTLIAKSPNQSSTRVNDNNTNGEGRENSENSNTNQFLLQKEQTTDNDIKAPQFKAKSYPKPYQYSNLPIPNQQRPNVPLYQRPQTNNIYAKDNADNNNDNISSMKTIYSNFSNEFQAKKEIFQSETINKEIERLDGDDDDDNANKQKEKLRFRTNSIDDFPHNQRDIARNDSSSVLLDDDRKIALSSLYCSQIANTLLSHGNQISTSASSSKISISSSSTLLSEQERELYTNYSPISYSEEFNFSKIISYLETLQSLTAKSNITSSIAIYLELMLLRQRMKLASCNLFAESNFNIRNELIQMIKASLKYNNYPKGFFDFSIAVSQYDESSSISYSNPSSTIDQMKDYCHSNPSISSMALISIISNQESLNDYIISLFDKEVINNKNGYWYFLLMVKSGRIDKLLQENSAILFDNFSLFVLILLENFALISNINQAIDSILKSNDPKMTYLHYIILFFLRNSFSIDQEAFHGKLITSFLNLCNIQKVILCDVFNYFCYCLNKNLPKVIAKSSILIKFKYTLIKLYDNDSSVTSLGKKIDENYIQFGQIGKNKYFRDYLKTSYVNNNEESNNKVKDNTTISGDNHYEVNTVKFNHKENQVDRDEKKGEIGYIKKDQPLNEPTQPLIPPNNNTNTTAATTTTDMFGGGLVSTIFSTFGIGLSQKQSTDTQNQAQGPRTYTQEELNQMPPEVKWKIEHPNEDEIYYDKEKKRYVLRGQIYDDQEEVIQKKEKEKPFVPPPKFNKSNLTQNNMNGNEEQNDYQDSYKTNPQYKVQTSTISNPFNSLKSPGKANPGQNNSKPKALTNRYAVGYHP